MALPWQVLMGCSVNLGRKAMAPGRTLWTVKARGEVSQRRGEMSRERAKRTGEVDTRGVKIVSEDDEPGRDGLRKIEEGLEVLHHIGLGDVRSWVPQSPVLSVERLLADAGPDDGSKVHGQADGANTVVNVCREREGQLRSISAKKKGPTSVRRAHGGRGDSDDGLDDLLAPSELSDDLLVGHSGAVGRERSKLALP